MINYEYSAMDIREISAQNTPKEYIKEHMDICNMIESEARKGEYKVYLNNNISDYSKRKLIHKCFQVDYTQYNEIRISWM